MGHDRSPAIRAYRGGVPREKPPASDPSFAERYLHRLVDEIVVQDQTATVRGRYLRGAGGNPAESKTGHIE